MYKINIESELPIGTEMWIMDDNKSELCLVAEYTVIVTSFDKNDVKNGWGDQLFNRWLNKKHKDFYNYSYSYKVKSNKDRSLFNINKINNE